MPIFLKSKAVFMVEFKSLVLNFTNANPKKFYELETSKIF